MLYLAEVLRKARVIGGGRAELKLLACQRGEFSWSAVPGEEIIPAPDDLSYGAGALVMVELSSGKQVQRYAEAGRQLVSILQNFSRLQEKSKTQEEEIEQWKQSLTYQSQELNRREIEIEAAQDQLQQIEEDLERLEKQRLEIETAQTEVDQLRAEFERKSQELEGAWAQLRGEASRLEERQAELQQMTVLDEHQATQFEDLLNRVASATVPTEALQAELHQAFAVVNQHQDLLNHHWQTLEQQRTLAEQMQAEVEQQIQSLQDYWLSWQQAQASLEQTRTELAGKQNQLQAKQEAMQVLTAQLHTQEALHQSVAQLASGTDQTVVQALEQMPIEGLQSVVADLEKDLEKLSRFVSSQEEELVSQQQAIDELRQQMQQASEYDRLRFEAELADEQDRYQMLNETLVGQRRNLQDRQATLKQHQVVLAKRQGYPLPEDQDRSVDVGPILAQIEQVRGQIAQQLQTLEQEIQQLQTEVDPAQATIAQQTSTQTTRFEELQHLDQRLRAQIKAAAELVGRVSLYQEMLQPTQDQWNQLKQHTESVAATINQLQEVSASQHHAIAELRTLVQQLTGNHAAAELAVS